MKRSMMPKPTSSCASDRLAQFDPNLRSAPFLCLVFDLAVCERILATANSAPNQPPGYEN
jgi:hypothetical protein